MLFETSEIGQYLVIYTRNVSWQIYFYWRQEKNGAEEADTFASLHVTDEKHAHRSIAYEEINLSSRYGKM